MTSVVTGSDLRPWREHLSVYGAQGRSPWLDVDWSAHQRWLSVGGQAVNLIELGQGPPLLLVHGLAGSWTNWLEQLPVLAADHRVLALDLPGFGHSPMPAETISLSGYARLLDRLLDRLGIEAVGLLGHSMGGAIACETALAFPGRVSRLVLVSAVGTRGATGEAMGLREAATIARVLINGLAGGWAASRADGLARRPRMRRAIDVYVSHPERLGVPTVAELIRGAGTPGFRPAARALVHSHLTERLAQIACPTLIVWGERDPQIGVRAAEVFHERIPGSRKAVFPDTGHVPMLERPGAFNALVQEFLGG